MDIESYSSFNHNNNITNNYNDFQQHSNYVFSSLNEQGSEEGHFNNNPNTLNTIGDYSSSSDQLNVASEMNVQSRIKCLEEELANTQADKEFVWSLWRQLQSTNPDVTSCIGSVVKREKEKTELKDMKVLEILQVKDGKIIGVFFYF